MSPFDTVTFTPVTFNKEAPGPLSGVRILDLSRLVAGNMLSMVLGDLGAEVIKVEPPSGDTLRAWRIADVETAWKAYSRNKQSFCIDLRHPSSRDVLLRLVRGADVLIESFRPGTLEGMDLGPAVLLEVRPSLVIARVSGWGQTGPYAQRPGFGTLVEGMSGFAAMNGFPDREPVLPPIYLGDMTAGLYGAVGVLAALRHVEKAGGTGQVVDISLLEPLVNILGPQAANYRLTRKPKPRTGSRSTNSAPRNVYLTADNHWVCLSASTQGMAEKLFRALGHPELIEDPRFATNGARLQHADELDALIGDFIAAQTRTDCVNYFASAGVTIGPVNDFEDIEKDAHFHARDIYVEMPDSDTGTVPVHNIAPRLSATPGQFRNPAPALGADNLTILQSAGFGSYEIEQLILNKVLCHSPTSKKGKQPDA